MMAFPLETLYPALVGALVLIVVVVAISFLSLVGTRETTYEEAIAEQKRKEKENLMQPKTEKVAKEKKKKHSKKVKDKPEKLADSEPDSSESPSSVTPPVEIIPPKFNLAGKASTEAPAKGAAGKTKTAKEQSPKEPKTSVVAHKNKTDDEKTKPNSPKDKAAEKVNKPVEEAKNAEKKSNAKSAKSASQKNGETVAKPSPPKSQDVEGEVTPKGPAKQEAADGSKVNHNHAVPTKQESAAVVNSDKKVSEGPKTKNSKSAAVKKDDVNSLTQSAPAPSPSKKSKKKDFGNGDNMVIGPRLITAIKDAVLTSDEIQALIEILLNRQQEGESWVKPGQKLDPLCLMKKQLQETEQKLAEETQLYQVTTTKLKETKLELKRSTDQLRLTRDKGTSIQQEYQNLQLHLQHSQEQHSADINSLKLEFQQVQSKLEKDHHLALQSVEEENIKLKHAITHMEAEGSDRARLQIESEQWRDNSEQLQTQVKGLQQTNGELQQHLCQLQQQLHEASEETNRHESACQTRLDEVILQLNQTISEKESLQISVQSLQTDKSSLHSKLVNLEKNSTNYSQTIKDLEARLKEKEENALKRVKEIESRQYEASHVAQKLQDENQSCQVQMKKLYDDLNKKDIILTQLQEEVNNRSNTLQKLNEDLETQRKKNDEAVNEDIKIKQDILRDSMATIFPNLEIPTNLNFDEWLQRFKNDVGDLTSKADEAATSSEDILKELEEARESANSLSSQLQHYQGILTDTENMLHKLQKSVESEEDIWKKRVGEKETESQQLKEEIRSLKEQNSSLHGNLEQIKSAQEMQEKLKELESKLRVEAKEKNLLEQRIKEAESSSGESSQKLSESSAALAVVHKENSNLLCQKQDIESDLEKEKKTNKDLNSQVVKLNSIIRMGQDSLKAEQELVKDLQQQLSEQKTSATNGSVELGHVADSTAAKK